MLKHSPQAPKVFTLSEYLIPSTKKTRYFIFEMKEISRRILAQIAAGISIALLNQINPDIENLVVDQLVYIPSRSYAKNPNSVRESLAYITIYCYNSRWSSSRKTLQRFNRCPS